MQVWLWPFFFFKSVWPCCVGCKYLCIYPTWDSFNISGLKDISPWFLQILFCFFLFPFLWHTLYVCSYSWYCLWSSIHFSFEIIFLCLLDWMIFVDLSSNSSESASLNILLICLVTFSFQLPRFSKSRLSFFSRFFFMISVSLLKNLFYSLLVSFH